MNLSVRGAFAHYIAVQNITMTYVSGGVSSELAKVENFIAADSFYGHAMCTGELCKRSHNPFESGKRFLIVGVPIEQWGGIGINSELLCWALLASCREVWRFAPCWDNLTSWAWCVSEAIHSGFEHASLGAIYHSISLTAAALVSVLRSLLMMPLNQIIMCSQRVGSTNVREISKKSYLTSEFIE